MIKQDIYGIVPSNYTPLMYSISSRNSKEYNQTDMLYLNISITDDEKNAFFVLPPLQLFKITEKSLLRGGCKAVDGVYESFGNCKLN